MYAIERRVQIPHQIGEFPVKRSGAADHHVVEIFACLLRRDQSDSLSQPPPRPVTPHGSATPAPLRPVLRHGAARHGETKAGSARGLAIRLSGPWRALEHKRRRHPLAAGPQPEEITPVFECAHSRHSRPARTAACAQGQPRKRQALNVLRRRTRRRARIFCPALELMRARKPCLRLRRKLRGWNVRFTVSSPDLIRKSCSRL